MKLAYRKDIDGLRAVAVLAVVIFHFNKAYLPGGFLGVDIFFVISGFLITSIISTEMTTNQFSFKTFYLRRIKRIIPASLFFIGLALIASYWLLLPHDFDRAIKSAFSAIVFASNFYFARNVDYFASASEENPFLHTWSLSVEEQFYLFWPLLLLFLYRRFSSNKAIFLCLVPLLIISVFIASYWASNGTTQKLAFYWLPSRFNELLIGAMGALVLSKIELNQRQRVLCTWLGVTAITASLILIDESTVFPGVMALPVCIGTLLLIISGHNNSDNKSIVSMCLSNPIATYIGKISFSLYLAHWPVLAFQRYISQQYELNMSATIICLILIWALSHFSWRWIETPLRKKTISFKDAFWRYFSIPSGILLGCCLYLISLHGASSRFGVDAKSFQVAEAFTCNTYLKDDCYIGDQNNILPTLLVGDSHGGHFLSYFDRLGKINHFAIEGRSVDGCAGVFSLKDLTPKMGRLQDCRTLKHYIHDNLRNYQNIIIAERWDARVFSDDEFINELHHFLASLENTQTKVILIAQVPHYACDVNRSAILQQVAPWAKQCGAELDANYLRANKIIADIAQQYSNTSIFSINHLLCKQGCSSYVDGKIAYKDDDHLNIIGAHLLAEKMKRQDLNWLY
ncbi:acyltransferase family protein [Alteromonadaceae bacterium BrNp21-10]|nr:acyltransferase family protein [Alteromonadaceae bacterium BrNp21-10]